MAFKKDFYQLLKKYKTLPYMDERILIQSGKKFYNVTVEIEEYIPEVAKPTHGDVQAMISYMVFYSRFYTGFKWLPADNPGNNPPLVGFMGSQSIELDPEEKNVRSCSVSLQTAIEAKMLSKHILAEVERWIKDGIEPKETPKDLGKMGKLGK